MQPIQIGHRDVCHSGIECKTFSIEAREMNKRRERIPCARMPRGSTCTCGLPHWNAYAGETEECYKHNVRLHLQIACWAVLQYWNPDVELNMENPENTLERHPL